MTDGGILDDSRVSPPDIALSSLFCINAFDEGSPKTEAERTRVRDSWISSAFHFPKEEAS